MQRTFYCGPKQRFQSSHLWFFWFYFGMSVLEVVFHMNDMMLLSVKACQAKAGLIANQPWVNFKNASLAQRVCVCVFSASRTTDRRNTLRFILQLALLTETLLCLEVAPSYCFLHNGRRVEEFLLKCSRATTYNSMFFPHRSTWHGFTENSGHIIGWWLWLCSSCSCCCCGDKLWVSAKEILFES